MSVKIGKLLRKSSNNLLLENAELEAQVAEKDKYTKHLLDRIDNQDADTQKQEIVIGELEAQVKEAQDHAATMENCARDAELKITEKSLSLSVSNQFWSKQLADSVPFEVFKHRCDMRFFFPEQEYRCTNAPITQDCTKQNCPHVAKPKT